jgi:hypothetical protein
MSMGHALRCVNHMMAILTSAIPKGVSMSKYAIGEKVDSVGDDDHDGGTVIAVFQTNDGNFRYAVDMKECLQFFTEERLIVHCN